MREPEGYRRELEREVTLRDGSRVRIRPIRPDDQARLVAFYGRLSEHSAYQRFFTVLRRLPPDWAQALATVDYRRRLALVAEVGPPEAPELIGVGRYDAGASDAPAEVALVVQDAWQGKGLGSVLMDGVAGAAAAAGIHRFRAYVLPDNGRMLRLLAERTRIERRTVEGGVVDLVFTRPGPDPPVR